MTSHQLLGQKFPYTFEEWHTIVVVVVQVADGGDRRIVWRDSDSQGGDFWKAVVLE